MTSKIKIHSMRVDRRHYDRAYERYRDCNPQLATAKRLRGSARWQRFRKWFKQHHPLCCDPFGWHARCSQVVTTQQVHHIVGLVDDPSLAFTESNCAALCRGCHSKIEAMTRKGQSTRSLFEGVGG